MKNPNRFYVYVLYRPWNGEPCYVGKGSGDRVRNHFRSADNHCNPHLANIIKKAGGELPYVILHKDLTEDEAFSFEVELIARLGRSPLGPLVNLTNGGEGCSGLVFSEEAILRIASGQLGRKHTPEHRLKNSLALKGNKNAQGTKHTASYKEVRRQALIGNELRKGVPWSEKTREHLTSVRSSEAYQKQQSLNVSELWKDPNYRERQLSSRKSSEAYQNRNKSPSRETIMKRIETRKRNKALKANGL